MKLARTQFPPLTKEDYLCEYVLTPETYAEFMELMKLPPDQRPGALRVKLSAPSKPRVKKPNAK